MRPNLSLAAWCLYPNDGVANLHAATGSQKGALNTRPCHCLPQSLRCVAIVLKLQGLVLWQQVCRSN